MIFSKVFTSAALGAALLFDQAGQVNGCSCLAVYYTPCDYVQGPAPEPTLVVLATALSRSNQTDMNQDVTYTVEVITAYKGAINDSVISFATGGNSAACGITLEIDPEYTYLLSLYGPEDQLYVGACDLYKELSQVPQEELDALEAGCDADQGSEVDGCFCPEIYFTPCDYVQGPAPEPTLVVLATAQSRSNEPDINENVTYTVEVITAYKGAIDDSVISFVTGGDSAACGITLEIGPEYTYLLSLYGPEDQLYVGACDLFRELSQVPQEELDALEAGCDANPADPCNSTCSLDQECLQYLRNEKYYCSDTCDSSPCLRGEECSTRPRKWCRSSGFAGCPEKRRCVA